MEQLPLLSLNHKVEHRQDPVKVMYLEEAKCLSIIPKYRFDTSKTITTRVDDFSTVRFDKNNYSVPAVYIGRDVTVKAMPTISVFCIKDL